MQEYIMTNKVAIIASNGGVFEAYKVFNIAKAAAEQIKKWPFSLLLKA